MASDQQIAANRRNATKSTGPRSAAGKAKAAQNARKHGFPCYSFSVPLLEDREEVVNLRHDLVQLYCPANSQELWAVERIALCQMSLIRASRVESGLLAICLDEAVGSDGELIHPMSASMAGIGLCEITLDQNRNFGVAESFLRLARKPHAWTLFLRYQAQAERLYRRAVQEFERLRALRSEFEEIAQEIAETEIPDEPNSPSQPQATEPDPTSGSNPIPDSRHSGGRTPSSAPDPQVRLSAFFPPAGPDPQDLPHP